MVIVRRVELENFLSHQRTVVEFQPGVTAIIGPNGAGKTSIVDAISFALFGAHSRTRGARGYAHLIRLGSAHAAVTVEFSSGGRVYRVVRRLRRAMGRTGRSQSEVHLYELSDGAPRPLARSAREVERVLAQLLGAKPDVAYLLYIVPQGSLEDVLVRDEDRLKLIDAVFKLEAMKKAYENMRYLIRGFEKEYEAVRRELENYRRDLNAKKAMVAELPRLRRRLEELRREREELARRLQELEEKLRRLEELRRREAELRAAADRAARELGYVEQQLGELEARIEELRGAEEEARSIGDLDAAERLASEIVERAGEVRRLERSLGELEARIEELSAYAEKARRLEAEAARYEEVRERLRELEAVEKEYQRLSSLAEEARRELERLRSEREKLEARVRAALARELQLTGLEPDDPAKLKERIDWLLATIEEQIDKAERKKEELRAKMGELKALIREKEDAMDKLGSAQGRCPLCERPLSDEERMSLIKRLRQEKKMLEAQLYSLEAKLRHLERELRELKTRREKLRTLREAVLNDILSLASLTRSIEEKEARLKELNTKLLETMPAHQEYRDLVEESARLEAAWREYQNAKARAEHLKELMTQADDLRTRLERERAWLVEAAARLGIEGDSVEALEAEARSLARRIGELRRALAEKRLLEEQLRKLEARRSELRAEAARAARELEELAGELERLGGVEDEYHEVNRRLREVVEEEGSTRGRVEQLEREEEELRRLEERVRKLEERARKLERAVSTLKRIREAFHNERGAPALVRRQAKAAMEYYMREILERFNIDFIDVSLGDDFEVKLKTRSGEKNVGMLSGGERVALALAYRLALARTAAGRLEMMILDEPTVHLDEERRKELIDIIRYGVGALGLTQLIIVSHDAEIVDAADHVVEVRRGAEGSRVEARPAESLAAPA